MNRFFSTRGGKTFIAGILILIVGTIAAAYDCPYDTAILVVGGILAFAGLVMYVSGNKRIDTGS